MKQSFLLNFFLLFTLTVSAQKPGTAARQKKIEFYILAGQSNMAGRGKVTPEYEALSPERLVMLNDSGKIVPAHHPIHFDKPGSAGVGPGMAFGIAMSKADPNVIIGLIPCAVGGTAISKWEPGAYDSGTKTHPLDDALSRIAIARKLGKIRGILWIQGESDSSPDKAAVYPGKLLTVIGRLREAAGDPRLPFIAGELGRFYKEQANINPLLYQVKAKTGNMEVVSSEGLADRGDQLHFDSPSADELGRRFAHAMLALQKSR